MMNEPTKSAISAKASIELPMRSVVDPAFAFIEGPRLLESIGDWRPRFNGYSGGFPPGYLEVIPTLMTFPDSEALDAMSDLGLRYVILHLAEEVTDSAYTSDQIEAILGALPDSASVTRVGSAWLVDLEPDR